MRHDCDGLPAILPSPEGDEPVASLVPTPPPNVWAISDVERILCMPSALGSIESTLPRRTDAWSTRFPGLDSFAHYPTDGQPLRICIATEDIAGPVRNGGIGTTYAALAEMLAADGNDVTILYLRGREVETETVDHWIDFYARKGVRFVPVPDYAEVDRFRTAADRWLRVPYNMLRYLLEHAMDVVHVSEWHGAGYLSLRAKRQGIAFAETLFVVKTSSPWMWNRLYGSHPLDRPDDLVKVTAERRSVELADMVVGGSLHLLRWMASQGYAIPRDRTFVQPNVASFAGLAPLVATRSLPGGARMPIDEIVFFGRLEARKGLFIFTQAIKRLIRLGVPLPRRITFMGKPGARMMSHPDQSTPDYIRTVTADWPIEVQILTDFQQQEAIEYLLSGARLAVMPSIIENSSMAVYEAAICGIPCVASDVGGNAELIHPDDRAAVLCPAHPLALGDKLAEAIRLGGMVARPSFNNDANLETWRRFHRQLGGPLRADLLRAGRIAPERDLATVSVCVYYTGDDEALAATLAALAQQDQPPNQLLVAVDADNNDAASRAEAQLRAHGVAGEVTEAFDLDAGASFNLLARAATGTHLLFLWEGATLQPAALSTLSGVAAASGAAVLNYFHRVREGEAAGGGAGALRAVILGSTSESFFHTDADELPLFVRRDTFLELDGFTIDYRVLAHDHEFVAKAQLAGVTCETALLDLGAVLRRSPDWLRARGYDLSASGFRAIRPKLAAAPLSMRDLLLLAKGLQARGGKRPAGEDVARKTESLLSRMMAGLAIEPGPAAKSPPRAGALPPRAAASAPTRPAPPAAGGRSTSPRPVAAVPAARTSLTPAISHALSDLIQRGAVRSEGPVMAQFLGVHAGVLHGWALSMDAPDRTLQVSVRGSRRAVLHDADQPFEEWAAVPPEARRHGFQVPVTPGWNALLPMVAPPAFAIDVAGSTLRVAEGRMPTAHAPLRPAPSAMIGLKAAGIEGYCDASDNGIVYGWARQAGEPDRRLDVTLLIDGAFFARVRADRDRADLRERGIGEGDYGFNVTLPRALREAGRRRIDVVVADLGLPLVRSPMHSEGDHIQVTRVKRRRGWFGR